MLLNVNVVNGPSRDQKVGNKEWFVYQERANNFTLLSCWLHAKKIASPYIALASILRAHYFDINVQNTLCPEGKNSFYPVQVRSYDR